MLFLINLRPILPWRIVSRSLYLRKLDDKETHLITRGYGLSFVNKIRIETKNIDLFTAENIRILKQSIKQWKEAHPFLNCQIRKSGDSSYGFYSVPLSDYNLENVFFLRVISKKNCHAEPIDSNYLSSLVINKFNWLPLSREKFGPQDLLWNLAILQLHPHKYDVIFDIHHSIIQARTSFKTIIQMFQVFEDNFLKREINLPKFRLFPGSESFFGHLKNAPTPLASDSIPELRIPTFLLSKPSVKEQVKSEEFESEEDDKPIVVYAENVFLFAECLTKLSMQNSNKNFKKGQVFETVRCLEAISSKLNVDNHQFILSESLSTNLVQKCKKEKATFGKCMEMVVAACLLDLYRQNGHELSNIVYLTFVCLRKYAQVSEDELCYMVGSILSSLDSKEIEYLGNEKFWQLVREKGEKFQEMLQSPPAYPKMKSVDHSKHEVNFHFSVSNMLHFDGNDRTRDGLVQARECFWLPGCISNGKLVNNRIFTHTLVSIDGKLNWTCSTAAIIKNKKVQDFLGLIQLKLQDILNY